MRSRRELAARWCSAVALLPVLLTALLTALLPALLTVLLTVLAPVVASTPTAGPSWAVALVAVVGVLAVTVLRRVVPTSPPAVLLRVRGRVEQEPARQSAPGRPGRPQPRAPGSAPCAPALVSPAT